ncbi:MAG: sodium:proton antiporter, partial [Bacteroidota bacterium]
MNILRHRRKLLWWYGAGSALALVAANAFPGVWGVAHVPVVNPWFIAPFVALLLGIAVAPFIDRHWWEKNYDAVAYVLGTMVVTYYVLGLHQGARVAHTIIEYVSFISLIGSLFVVAGGIHIGVRGRATPEENVVVLGLAGMLANVLGTTGASMIFIRPFLRMNRSRFRPYHGVFFIFIVSNIGGALTPIGDPPLFLGYLKSIPFFWVAERVGLIWILTLALVLGAFYALDRRSFIRLKHAAQEAARAPDETRVTGVHNILFLIIILGAVFIDEPAPRMLREVVMWGAALGSLLTTAPDVYERNEFTIAPIREVAVLFIGIFLTMMPALDWLELNAARVGISTPGEFYWGTGLLSGFLDNAPTYLTFLSAAFGLHGASLDNPMHMLAVLG